ncbi:MAG: NUDIX hydrolase [Chitinophagaceae bacterium]|jgi:8-oxo-dGTP pyrophosphatase MutT (NUDIX family)|nr:NUDIX hydrolase [Chitinophagaceae bacterium]OQY94287.1 MAG: NUDIX hydrolase [Sphingobacteriales bacterium UTBCD1]
MHIKIFFNDKPLFLCDAIDEVMQPLIHHDDVIFMDELNAHTIKTIIHEMQKAPVHAGVFFNKNLSDLKKAFFKKFSLIMAAGGLIQNEKSEVLLIFRKGKWDLPKGKLDKEEKLEDCAIREVQEETGLQKVKLNKFLTLTYHTYHEGTRFILKETHWFLMKTKSGQTLIPQTEEEIIEIRWAKKDELPVYLMNSYPSVADVLKIAFKII